MSRLTVSPAQQALIDAFKTENASTFDPEIAAGSTLVEGDHLEIDNSWYVIAIAGQWGCVACMIPDWGDLILAIDLVDYVTDRAGPNGEEMPIFDAQQLQARAASKTQAVEDKHGHHRETLRRAVREAIKRLPHDEEKAARDMLKQKGVL